MAASPRRKSSSSSSNSSHRPISGFRGGRTGTLTGADWWYGGADPAILGLAIAGMGREAEVGDCEGDSALPLPVAAAEAAAMVALRRSRVPALAAAAAAAVPPPPAPPRTRRRLSPSCIASAARRPRCPGGAPRPVGLLVSVGGGGAAASGDEKRKSSSWSSSPATNEGSVGDDEGVDGDENIPMNRSPAGDRRVRCSSIARSLAPVATTRGRGRGRMRMRGPKSAPSPPSGGAGDLVVVAGGGRRRGRCVFLWVWFLWASAPRDPPRWSGGERGARRPAPHAAAPLGCFLLGSGHTLTRSIRRRGRGCLAVAATDMGEGRPRG
nr:unnamed protein product [Digitaria exilis]